MCGFTGFIDFTDKNLNYSSVLDRCNEMISFRGPDQRKKYIDDNNKIYINFNRLSFFDLSEAGNQPMISKDKRFLFIMNGEIYNFSNLRDILFNYNISVNSKSDTSVSLEFIASSGLLTTSAFDKLATFFANSSFTS